jgi:molecular chaperone IbpA
MTNLARVMDLISQSFDTMNDMPMWAMPNFNYPKVNLSRGKDGKYKFEFAVAGFDESELSVEVVNDYILISGIPGTKESNYIWKNISTKPFGVKIKAPNIKDIGTPELVNGILSIEMGEAAEVQPRKITIKKPIKE